MCDACTSSDTPKPLATSKRRRLWELTDGWHCSVIGTCLTLADLRAFGRKLNLKLDQNFPPDYQLHGFFSSAAGKPDIPGKLLGKMLDKRHAGAIRRVRELKTDLDIRNHWVEAVKAGYIPGPYWALLTDPRVCSKFCERMFADVHMLSHLVGASNRAGIRQLQVLEKENDALWSKMRRMVQRHHNRIAIKNAALQAAEEDAGRARMTTSTNASRASTQTSMRAPVETSAIHELEAGMTKAEELCREQAQRIEKLSAVVANLKQENQALERELAEDLDIEALDENKCPFDLGGRCVLYVGGRKQAITRLRALVETWNGELLHHDGGLEKSINELAGAVVRADTVVFPTDCVSHEAINKVKKLCRQTMKPYVPLRSSGMGSLIAGLQAASITTEYMQPGE